MSCRLYVGNYPSHFSRKDVADMFEKFEGISLDRSVKKALKSYSFFVCRDIDQLVSVVQEMNNKIVSGRQLIVRASDQDLQDYVELLLKEASDESGTSFNPLSNLSESSVKNVYDVDSEEIYGEKSYELSEENCVKRMTRKNFARKPRDFGRGEGAESNGHKTEKTPDEISQLIPVQVLKNKTYQNSCEKRVVQDQFETNSSHSSCPSSPSLNSNFQGNHQRDSYDRRYRPTTSSRNSDSSKSPIYEYPATNFAWVSVTNFPLGTSVRSIFDLFCDYEPLKVRMICNEARRDRTLTEAHVCFLNQDIADDVILNFDNTFFDGRLILVNDTKDLTVMNELLDVLPS